MKTKLYVTRTPPKTAGRRFFPFSAVKLSTTRLFLKVSRKYSTFPKNIIIVYLSPGIERTLNFTYRFKIMIAISQSDLNYWINIFR